MKEPRIVRREDQEEHPFHGGGRVQRLIYPTTVGSARIFIGVAEAEPGATPHDFHQHGVEIHGDIQMSYAPDFEEFYYVLSGNGLMQWKLADGTLCEQPVAQGDAIFMPAGSGEHRIFNNADRPLRVLYGGTPPATVTKVQQH